MRRCAVVGGGILGLTLARDLARRGVRVDVLEAAPQLGGLASALDYGEFVWDRFYHCILPTDVRLIGLLEELGLGQELRWKRTQTGYFTEGRAYPMSGNADFLRYPHLTWIDKARLAWCTVQARKFCDPRELAAITAREWLVKTCGQRGYDSFWRPLLRAKFGPYHDRVAASFIWATLTRLFGARSGAAQAEHLGYVSGGYARILRAFEEDLLARGARLRTGVSVEALGEAAFDGAPTRARLALRAAGGSAVEELYDQVFFTAPTAAAREIAEEPLRAYLDEVDRRHPSGRDYLGVVSCNLVLRRPLTPYYVLNIAAEDVELTGLIEITNLIDPQRETRGRSLVYLPRYLPSDSPAFDAPDSELEQGFLERGLARLFPELDPADIVARTIQRARRVQALPLARADRERTAGPGAQASGPIWRTPVLVLNTSMLDIATLNNDEVVGLVQRFTDAHDRAIASLAPG